jgi:AraC-like DNA-binding protein
MKPYRERLPVVPDASWSLLNRRLEDGIPFQWHHHPEFELTLTLNSRGQRFIGDHVESFDDGDLVLVGPNLPHTWSASERLDPARPHVALVMWFRPEWTAQLGEAFVELRPVAALAARAGRGLRFSAARARAVRPRIEALFAAEAPQRLLALMDVLGELAADDAAVPLASAPVAFHPVADSRARIDRVLTHIHAHYAEGPSLAELADIAALSPSGLHRLFRRHTGASISDYLMRLRVGEACALLAAGSLPVAHIAEAVGYHALANFNRQFKALKGVTPRDYRRAFGRNAAHPD